MVNKRFLQAWLNGETVACRKNAAYCWETLQSVAECVECPTFAPTDEYIIIHPKQLFRVYNHRHTNGTKSPVLFYYLHFLLVLHYF